MDHAFFMQKALDEAWRALNAGEFPVGCVMVHQDKIVATGIRSHSSAAGRNELDHAEMTALRRVVLLGPEIDRKAVTVFSTLEPCLMCYAALIVNGIRRIVYAYEDVLGGGTNIALDRLRPFYSAMDVQIVPGVLREKSLALFRQFFSNPDNDYLKGTPLARHALGER